MAVTHQTSHLAALILVTRHLLLGMDLHLEEEAHAWWALRLDLRAEEGTMETTGEMSLCVVDHTGVAISIVEEEEEEETKDLEDGEDEGDHAEDTTTWVVRSFLIL